MVVVDPANKTSLETSDIEKEGNDSGEELRCNGSVSDDEDETRESSHTVRTGTNSYLRVEESRASLENSENGTEHLENDSSECDEEIPENVSADEDVMQHCSHDSFSERGDVEESDSSSSV